MRRSAVSEKHLAKRTTCAVGIDHAEQFHSRMPVLPIPSGMRCGKVPAGIAEGSADGALLFGRDKGDDCSRWVKRADAFRRIDGKPDRNAGGCARRFDTGRPTNHSWEEQGAQRAPRIQLFAVNVEPVRSGTQS